MKAIFLILSTVLTFTGLLASPIQEHKIDSRALAELARSLGIAEDANILYETQKCWLGKNQERWELAELPADKKEIVLDWARHQGIFSSWKPVLTSYDTVLILGATTSRMEIRLNYLKELWTEGVRFKEIVWLTGNRPLNSLVDDFFDRANTESEAARLIWKETVLPDEMRDIPVSFIAVPMKIEGSSLKRPNTEDTIVEWLKVAPQCCTALFISNQPFCTYQFSVIKTCIPETIQFDVVGNGVDPNRYPTIAAITLDSIARWIYQENVFQSKER